MKISSAKAFLVAAGVVPVLLTGACASTGKITALGEPSSGTASAGSSGGASKGSGVSIASLQQASSDTAAATSGRFEFTMDTGSSSGEPAMKVTGEFNPTTSHLAMTMDDESGELPVPMSLEIIVNANSTYLHGSLFSMIMGGFGPDSDPESALTGDQSQWYKADTAAMSSSELDQMTKAYPGPKSVLKLLDGAFGKVEKIGTEDVRGVSTTHHRVQVDLDKVVKSLASDGKESAAMLKIFEGAMGSPAVDVWVTEKNEIRRVLVELEGPDGEVASLQNEMWDIGADVSIDLPAAKDVKDVGSMFGK